MRSQVSLRWADVARLLVPADLAAHLPERIEGADQLRQALVTILTSCGHRTRRVTSARLEAPAAES